MIGGFMVHLDEFIFPNEEMEFDFFMSIKRKCYDNFYPFKVLSRNKINRIDFEPITIFYGNNGSGKTRLFI
jgi:AAA15 family ATPase/GTPase